MSVHIRWMIKRDLDRVLQIENSVYGDNSWTRADFLNCLANRDCIGLIADANPGSYHPIIDDGNRPSIVCYSVYRLSRKKIEILNFAVDPQYQRQGIGTAMVDKLKLKTGDRKVLTTTVRESNLPMLLFLRANGFFACRLERDMYESGEDGILLHYLAKNKAKRNEQRSNTI